MTMDARTVTALEQSIKHWERVAADPLNEPATNKECPLCTLFFDDGCAECPVMNATGKPYCLGTAYIPFAASISVGDEKRARLWSGAELVFLKSLMPRAV